MKFLNIQNQFKYVNVIAALAASLQTLGQQNHEKLLLLYKRSFLTRQPVATFCLDVNNPLTQYCGVLPKFRNNAKLNNNFNDLEIVLLLMLPTQPHQSNEQYIDFIIYKRVGDVIMHQQQLMPKSHDVKKCKCFTLKSQHGGYGIKYTLRNVDIIGLELRECYHPAQRVNSNPIFIAGQSYQQSIYN